MRYTYSLELCPSALAAIFLAHTRVRPAHIFQLVVVAFMFFVYPVYFLLVLGILHTYTLTLHAVLPIPL